MSDNLVLELLRAMRADDAEMRRELREQRGRLVAIEAALVGVRRDNADAYGQFVLLGQRLDAVNDRLDRIERRLDLTDASA